MSKNNIVESLDSLKEEFEDYIDKELEYRKMITVEKVSKLSVSVVSKLLYLYLLLFILLFLSIAAAFLLGEITGSNSLGFIVVSGFYLVLLLLFILLKPYIIEKPIIKAFIKLFFQKEK